jgi:heparin/heparan-sulfate lyase
MYFRRAWFGGRLILITVFIVASRWFLSGDTIKQVELFENLGKPVKMACLLNYSAGPDASGVNNKIYMAFHEPDGALLVEVTLGKKNTRQYKAPSKYQGPWGFTVGFDKKVYMGCSGYLMVFDPAKPEKGIVDLGKPSESETVIWSMALAGDGKIYGSTYPNCRLISYDPANGEMRDLGRLDPKEEYARPVAAGKDGWIYTGVGSQRGQVVGYQISTGKMQPVIPDEQRPNYWGRNGGWHLVWLGEDGYAYGEIGEKTYKFLNGQAIEIQIEKASPKRLSTLADGRILVNAKSEGLYWLKNDETGDVEKFRFDYEAGFPQNFLVANGPKGKIYGSSILPLVMFTYDPQSGKFSQMDKMTTCGGEVYSFAYDDSVLYYCAYPGAKLGIFNVEESYKYGTNPQNNPFDYGAIAGDGHNRPRAMVVGPYNRVYIGSYCSYGQLGGSFAVFDPNQKKVVENYRNIVPNQSIISLASNSKYKQIFAGSSVRGGNGIKPTEKEAVFFAWDPVEKKKLAEVIPVRGHGHIVSMCANDDRVYMITAKEHNTFGGIPEETSLAVYDIEKKFVLLTRKFDFGMPIDTSLGIGDDSNLYGLTEKGILRINSTTMEIDLIESPVKIQHGFAINNGYIYFCSGSDIWRFNLTEFLREEKNSTFSNNAENLKYNIRKDHPRLFLNSDIFPEVKERALGRDNEFFQEITVLVDESIKESVNDIPAEKMIITSDKEYVYNDPSEVAAKSAFVYLITGQKKYYDYAVYLLDRAVIYYEKCFAERKTAGWFSTGRMAFLMTWDWLYNELPIEKRSSLMNRFMELVDKVYNADPPIFNENMAGITTGFYGVDGIKWYCGVATIGTGIKPELSHKWLKDGFKQHMELLQYRSGLCGDDGGSASATINYTFGAYPWAEHNFYFTYLSATGKNIALEWPFSASLANFMWWNLIRGPSLVCYGYGDHYHTNNNRFTLRWSGGHLKNLYHFYKETEWAPLIYYLWKKTGRKQHDKTYFIQPFLTSDMKSPVEKFRPDEMPLARHFENLGLIIMRSGFTYDDTYALFTAGGLTGQHKHYDALHFTIYHKGFLALDSGTRASHLNHLLHYYSQTVAHNSLLILQPGEPPSPYWGLAFAVDIGSGGQHRKLGSKVTAFETNDDFAYIAADATECYIHGSAKLPEKAQLVSRQFVYLRPHHFIIFDKVRSTRPEFRKQWLLHFANEPLITGQTIRADQEQGRLFCKSLLPEKPLITVIGGKGKEFMAAGRNWDIMSKEPLTRPSEMPSKPFTEEEKEYFGQWRIEVESSEPEIEMIFLHVLETADQQKVEMSDVKLVTEGNYKGVCINLNNKSAKVLFDVTKENGGEIEISSSDKTEVEKFILTDKVQKQSWIYSN